MFCGLLGSHEQLDTARLLQLYPSLDEYVAKVTELTRNNLGAGYLVKRDGEATISEEKWLEHRQAPAATPGPVKSRDIVSS
jgi:Alpha/beta hydrolase domain